MPLEFVDGAECLASGSHHSYHLRALTANLGLDCGAPVLTLLATFVFTSCKCLAKYALEVLVRTMRYVNRALMVVASGLFLIVSRMLPVRPLSA